MTKTYAQVVKQIDQLNREAERLKQKEVDSVIARIKEAISVYGLTASDLGLTGRRVGNGKTTARTKVSSKTKRKGARAVKFRDQAGNTWGGRGPRPHWLREALAAGKELKDFAV
jgi:DNA-binding protein H-NS